MPQKMPSPLDPLLTPDQLGQMLGKTKASLAQWRTAGRGPAYVKAGNRIYYRQADVDAWLDASTIRTTESPRTR